MVTILSAFNGIEELVEELWAIYDEDKSGSLDYDETKLFITETLTSMGQKDAYNDHAFTQMFKRFDTDGNGLIDQEEMKRFIAGLVHNSRIADFRD